MLFLWLARVAPAAAQQPTVVPAPDKPEFFSRSDFHLNAAWLRTVSAMPALPNQVPVGRRFMWDTFWGGSADIVDYVGGRAGVFIDYEAVLGGEYQAFDPNQGNYTLEAFASGRINDTTEIVGIFHHVSRHLSDRPKRFAIAWNLLGARALKHFNLGRGTVDIDLEGGRIVQHSYVDYQWMGELHLQARRPINDYVAVYGRGMAQWVGINGEVPGRGRQAGGFLEAGVRLKGTMATMELFAGVERRVDADPLDRLPRDWALAGFRIVSR